MAKHASGNGGRLPLTNAHDRRLHQGDTTRERLEAILQRRRWARRLAVTAVATTLFAAAGCSSDTTPNTTTIASASAVPAASTTSNAAATSSTSAATAALRVPDAFTAVTVRPLSDPTFRFKGSDGKYHVAYDLELTNASALPARS